MVNNTALSHLPYDLNAGKNCDLIHISFCPKQKRLGIGSIILGLSCIAARSFNGCQIQFSNFIHPLEQSDSNALALTTTSKALIVASKALVKTSTALVTSSKALVTTSKELVASGYSFADTYPGSISTLSAKIAAPAHETQSKIRKKICLFTSYTEDNPTRLKMSKLVAANQYSYAKKQGYEYLVYPQNMANEDEIFEEWLPYWSKIAIINKILNNQEPRLEKTPEWLVWLDDDAPITNKDIKVEEIIKHYAPEGSNINFLVTQDSMSHKNEHIPLNSAVLFVKNNEWSRKFFQKVWEMKSEIVPQEHLYQNCKDQVCPTKTYTYGNCPSQSCLHEQQAITELMKRSTNWWKPYTVWGDNIKIIPQRDMNDPKGGWGINTFHRWDHFDRERRFSLKYNNDAPGSRWQENDFIGQCTGLAIDARIDCINQLLDSSFKKQIQHE